MYFYFATHDTLETVMQASPNQPSPAEISEAAHVLAKLEPGFLPFDIFLQVARLTTLSIIELVPVRYHEGSVEVLLLARPVDDPLWPGMVHNPGTVIRPTDHENTFVSAFERIFSDELPGLTPIGKPHEFESYLRKSKRGMENSRLFWIEVEGTPLQGQFYDINDLPNNLITTQRAYILSAARLFGATQQVRITA